MSDKEVLKGSGPMPKTKLFVGAVSKNCVDAAIEIANTKRIPIYIIASRSQIDSKEMGCGYVNNWSTEEFASYVRKHDRKHQISLVRDHGGPWQSEREISQELSLDEAMESAKASFLSDIRAGFNGIHIDTSIDIENNADQEQLMRRAMELYQFCCQKTSARGHNIFFEIGTEEQAAGHGAPDELELLISTMKVFCTQNNLPHPRYIVGQIGTKVMEMQNIGNRYGMSPDVTDNIINMVKRCNQNSIKLKAHNVDYLSEDLLKTINRCGVHAANIAPEFGVTETKAFIDVLENYNLYTLIDEFINLAYESGKWKKWMFPDTSATRREKAIIAGHYVFGTKKFGNIKQAANRQLLRENINLDEYLKSKISICIQKYIKAFQLESS